MLALALVIALAAWLLLFRGSGGYEYTLMFENAGQLVKDDDVQVGGRRIGSMKDITLSDDNLAAVKVKVQEPYAPLREGTQATIRLTSLSGIANRYIALTPGPRTQRSSPDGATLTTASTQPVVDLDQLFNTLDAKTRGSLQDVVQGFADPVSRQVRRGRSGDQVLQPAAVHLAPAGRRGHGGRGALTRLIVDGSSVVTALAEKRHDLSALVGNANTTAGRDRLRERRARRARSGSSRRRSGGPTRRS